MPYGLTEAPATFQRLLDRLIGPEMEPFAFAYLDGIVIVTPTFEEHMVWLKRVLDKITSPGLTVNPDKCEFYRSQVRYLGFIVQGEGLTETPRRRDRYWNIPPHTILNNYAVFWECHRGTANLSRDSRPLASR